MDLLRKYYSELDKVQYNTLCKLEQLYREKNEKVNVISRKDIDNFIEHHVLVALAISKLTKFEEGTSVLDIGTGGGLPGIPLAIIFPNVNFTLVDSRGKKIDVVNSIVKKLGLKNVEGLKIRSNEIKNKFDFVIGRGVTDPSNFMQLASKNLLDKFKKESIFYVSRSGVQAINNTSLNKYYTEEYFANKSIYVHP